MSVQNMDKEVFQNQGDHLERSGHQQKKVAKRAEESCFLNLFHLWHLPRMQPPHTGSSSLLNIELTESTAAKLERARTRSPPLSPEVYSGLSKESLKLQPLSKESTKNKESASAGLFPQGHVVESDAQQSSCQNDDLTHTVPCWKIHRNTRKTPTSYCFYFAYSFKLRGQHTYCCI